MGGLPAPRHEDRSRYLLMLGGVLLLMGALLYFGGSDEGSAQGFDGSGASRTSVPRGNYQPAPMVPGAPIAGPAGGSPINDAPSVTIIEDVRDTMRRLPDRETPRGWGGKPTSKPG